MTEKWLITGGTGLLGSQCAHAAAKRGHDVTAQHHSYGALGVPRVTWRAVDLRDANVVGKFVRQVQPSVVIHTAAIAQPKDCEVDPALAEAVNVRATVAIADAMRDVGGRLIHLSTDLVFAGDQAPYDENDPRTPIHVYGRNKVQAEDVVNARCPNSVIVRTSLQMGPSPRGTRGIEEQLHAAMKKGERPKLFVDEYRQPMAAADLAEVLGWLATTSFTGVLHVAGPERLSRYEIGKQVAEAFGFPLSLLDPVPLSAAPNAVPPRAPDVTLKMDRFLALRPPFVPRRLRDVLTAHPFAVH